MSEPLPWFPLWAGDFLLSRTTARMSSSQVGVYMLFLMHEWLDGPLPIDVDELAFLGRCSTDEAEAMIKRCFIRVEAGLINERLETVRAEQEEKRAKLSAAGRKGGKKSKRGLSQAQARPKQSESESELEKKKNTSICASDLWAIWLEELGGPKPHPKLTPGRSSKLVAFAKEHLADVEDPKQAFRRVLRAVKQSDHHMSQRAYQMPESIFRNSDRRDSWWLAGQSSNGATAGALKRPRLGVG